MPSNRPDEPPAGSGWSSQPDPTRDSHSAFDEPPDQPSMPALPLSPAQPPYPPPWSRPTSTGPTAYGPSSYGPTAYGQWNSPSPPAWVPPPNNYLVLAILTTLFCFPPFGIVSIVKATSVNTLWSQGRWAEAQAASASARTWALWALAALPILLFGWGIVLAGLASVA